MPDLEAVGDAVTGGVLARAVEPAAGEAAAGRGTGGNCLNCGTPLAGEYCHSCGQKAHVHRTLSAFWHDLLHGVLHFEGKIWRTLPLLAWRPGELTRRYIDGERARFVSPIALFLFSVFLMFALASFTGGLATPDNAALQADVTQELAAEEGRLSALRREREAAVRQGRPTTAIDLRIADKRQEVAVLRGIRAGDVSRVARTEVNAPAWLRAPIEKAARNPELLFYKLRTNAYKFSWALIPLSVPFLWLLFPFSRRFHLYDHTVFVTYSLGFMTLLVVAAILVGMAGLPQVAGFAMLVPPVHMYLQLKGAYGLSRAGALVRTVLLLLFAAIAFGLFALALVALGLFD